MKKKFSILRIVLILGGLLSANFSFSQLGFCQGNSGDPIFTETFGIGTDYGPPLAAGTTTYNFVGFAGPQDGEYTLGSSTFEYGWSMPSDHTPGDVNGKALIVNASFTAGEFYNTTVSGLCENTSYEFSSWLINILPSSGCGGNGIPVNVSFEIWDITDTTLLASGNTGNIFGMATPTWEQYGLVFQTLPGQTSVILKMINNGVGGCGNDLAIDDIVFKSCGDFIGVNDTPGNQDITICSSQTPFDTTITANPDNTVFSDHFYQWQESTDGTIWTDIVGATNESLVVSGITTSMFYRAKVAEFATNLNNDDCITFSDVYTITVNQAPDPPILECWETATFDDTSCSWTVTGTQPSEPTGLECWETATFNNVTCSWEVTGTQPPEPTGLECWESTSFNTSSCSWEIIGTQPTEPSTDCWETATFNNVTCSWEITGTQPPEPTGLECWESTSFNTASCSWEIIGTQPAEPSTECWETATFNNTLCDWEITGAQPPEPTGLECWEVATFNDTTCSWEVNGSEPEEPTDLECWQTASFNVTTCSWEIQGTQPPEPSTECWETATFNTANCAWEVTGTQPEEPTDLECWETATFSEVSCSWEITGTQFIESVEESLFLCENEVITLQAEGGIDNPTYEWSTGQITEFINVDAPGVYTVVTTDGCVAVEKAITVEAVVLPIIESVITDGNDIVVTLANSANAVFSIDGINYQSSNIFYDVVGGKYTIYVKSLECDTIQTQEHLHFFVPRFFTPNDDSVNDTFNLFGLDCFESSEVYIFDRYGKLLYSARNRVVSWDGTFNNKELPTNDYWYVIVADGLELTGHFTLKR